MLKVKVSHKIGDVVQRSFGEQQMKVIGYMYTEGKGMQYVCMQGDKIDWAYLSEVELAKGKKHATIGFSF